MSPVVRRKNLTQLPCYCASGIPVFPTSSHGLVQIYQDLNLRPSLVSRNFLPYPPTSQLLRCLSFLIRPACSRLATLARSKGQGFGGGMKAICRFCDDTPYRSRLTSCNLLQKISYKLCRESQHGLKGRERC